MHNICSLYVSKNPRIYRINCQICSLPRGNLCAGIAVPLEPFWITQNNWPSGKFRITLPQVKFLGEGTILLARLPLPFPLLPWQSLQAVGFASSEKSFLPFSIFSLVGASGFTFSRYLPGALSVFLFCGQIPETVVTMGKDSTMFALKNRATPKTPTHLAINGFSQKKFLDSERSAISQGL